MDHLYSFLVSSASFRVRIAASLMQVDLAITPIDLLSGEQQNLDYQAINPIATVPTLAVEKNGEMHYITDSLAIIHYLAECTDYLLYPDNPLTKARVTSLAYTLFGLQESSNALRSASAEYGVDQSSGAQQKRHNIRIHQKLPAIEHAMRTLREDYDKTDCLYAFDDAPAILDIMLIPQLYNAIRYAEIKDKVQAALALENDYPLLMQLYQQGMQHPAILDASPLSARQKMLHVA